ncbi:MULTISPECIES: hypothetical protein [Acetobacter]|uniref:Uncharacterized protein n=4 Tax=Acetobacter TaxID=434 RepID=A0AAN1U836_9PROT|nr:MULTISPECIES: hypothetical protein [Acetobacter]ASL41243.1 hypothetical protein CBI36_13220 [Acetobacter oryzifermentans]AXM99435.1 hypothetical protein CJF59_01715 [Acetobacter pomorum]KAA8393104.1 hypothetical protein FKW19_14435 [Acetobacter sp. DmW_125128]KAA8393574.1 hypothetical protein FKW22_11720 [Acetobacter sp. DmW_125124]KAA8396777.1 hypothetical protein FKW20_10575 [Acetobacter sp. DmW_125127]
MKYSVEKMIALGGAEWIRDEMHRIYFNADVTAELIGFEYCLRKGRVSSAKLNGEKISNARGQEILVALDFGKIWFDVATGEFHSKNIPDTLSNEVMAAIKVATEITEDAPALNEVEMSVSAKIVSAINAQTATVAEIAHSLWLKPDGRADNKRIRAAQRAGEFSDDLDLIASSDATAEKYDSACANALAQIACSISPETNENDALKRILDFYGQNNDAPRFGWRNIVKTSNEINDRQRNSSEFWQAFLNNSGWFQAATAGE